MSHVVLLTQPSVSKANILIGVAKRAVIADFGLASVWAGPLGLPSSATNYGKGTPGYIAPECYQGPSVPKSDIFAFAMVCYQAS